MDKIMLTVETEVKEEYVRAIEKFGKTNHSDHESYAILLEEFEEALLMVEVAQQALDNFWTGVKENQLNSDKLAYLEKLRIAANCAACEFIQVATMAYKARVTIKVRG